MKENLLDRVKHTAKGRINFLGLRRGGGGITNAILKSQQASNSTYLMLYFLLFSSYMLCIFSEQFSLFCFCVYLNLSTLYCPSPLVSNCMQVTIRGYQCGTGYGIHFCLELFNFYGYHVSNRDLIKKRVKQIAWIPNVSWVLYSTNVCISPYLLRACFVSGALLREGSTSLNKTKPPFL